MGDSREGSPDWLREFQAPTQNLLTLSSTSDSSPEASLESSKETRQPEPEMLSMKQDKFDIDIAEDSPVVNGKNTKTLRTEKKKTEKEDVHEGPAEEDTGEAPAEEDTRDTPAGPSVSSRLPLVFPEKAQRSKALVECDGDAIDLSGDVGAVGRIVISNDPAGNKKMILDLTETSINRQ
ncbi:DNA-binding protein BIN4 [Iris pallida]|uniref:DNA-binding protein BIN4 n=1 Tax=Iris pallida TaxID=29817 RepID=A0AAX6F7P5_IRIPA|nr:DNA-binding protein BIN4 [Iris pallida]